MTDTQITYKDSCITTRTTYQMLGVAKQDFREKFPGAEITSMSIRKTEQDKYTDEMDSYKFRIDAKK